MLIFAHRGASAIEPENTIAAFQAVSTANSDGFDFGIHQDDGILILIHDRYLERTTSGSGLLSQHSFAQLRQLDAGNGELIPTLDEVLAIVANQRVINIELKGIEIADISLLFDYLDNAKKILNISFEQLLLSSFNHHLLQAISQQRPEFTLGALTACLPLNNAKFAQQLNAYSVHIAIDYVNEEFIIDAHQRGLKVYVYTVDEMIETQRMKVMGVDGIFSNNPAIAMQNLQQI